MVTDRRATTAATPLAGVVEDLAYRFEGVFSRETVERYVRESYDLIAGNATVTGFLPVLAGRFARERLMAAARTEGLRASTTPEVLFICVQNAGRSQMAAAWLHELSGGRVHVRSAGSLPGDAVSTAVMTAMTEVGIDLTEAFPKPLTDEVVRASDIIVTMGCGDACPVYEGKRYLDWDLPDPAGLPISEVRPIRDEIRELVVGLLAELLPDDVQQS